MTRPKSLFRAWFVAQFGKPPRREPLHILRDRVEAAGFALWSAKLALWEAERYAEWEKAALCAWQARADVADAPKGGY